VVIPALPLLVGLIFLAFVYPVAADPTPTITTIPTINMQEASDSMTSSTDPWYQNAVGIVVLIILAIMVLIMRALGWGK